MIASLPEVFFWTASAGVYAAAIVVILWRMAPLHCRPQPLAALLAVGCFAADRAFPNLSAVFAPLLYVGVFAAAVGIFRTFRIGNRIDALFAMLYVEALAPMLVLVLADFFAAAQAFRIAAIWICALPAPSVILYLIVTRNQTVP